jgi:hypothetical protein
METGVLKGIIHPLFPFQDSFFLGLVLVFGNHSPVIGRFEIDQFLAGCGGAGLEFSTAAAASPQPSPEDKQNT